MSDQPTPRDMSDAGALVRDTWLKQWRDQAGTPGYPMSQLECANSVGISRSRWAEIEGGASCFMETALKIEALTGIASRDFHKRSKWRKPAKRSGKR